jgi:protocatechuate 3,4-dioxygenase beta subunit
VLRLLEIFVSSATSTQVGFEFTPQIFCTNFLSTEPKKFRRDLATLEVYEAIDHNATSLYDYTIDTAETTIFSANTSCILTPEVTDGPYYVTGELIRKNVTEGQAGVPLYLEVQYLDITTCLPVEGIYVDIWNANATGVYSGINVTGNVADGGWDSTYLRGIQSTDTDGVVSFETIFPGHYEGRATHTHLLAHENVTVLSNGTISGGAVTHIGQLFWNEELRSAVELTSPCKSAFFALEFPTDL